MQEIFKVHLTRPKKEIAAAANGNINRWINGLIEHALGEKKFWLGRAL